MSLALNVRLDEQLVERVDEFAALELRSRSGAVRVLLREALAQRAELRRLVDEMPAEAGRLGGISRG